ncbi:EAL domain-containing protein [Niallia sp. JL1B1071]|uniref:bifunctional diguanylate cyclase/phosphodiesterase n=1 Tax=Niallia tiangongensis TaxID=3237105 RepID=UPI0037DD0A3E
MTINLLGIATAISFLYIVSNLKSKEKNIREIFNNNDITFWSRDMKTGLAVVSEGYAKIYGLTRHDFDKEPDFWITSVHHEDKTILLNAIKEQQLGKKTKVVYRIKHANGEIRWLEDRATPIMNKNGQITRVDRVTFDVTTQKITEEKMHQMAYTDALTGLPNRNSFHNYVNKAISNASQNNITTAVIFIDFVDFKRVNDTLGHSGGDAVLKQIATRLQRIISNDQIISRQSGDEFLVLVDNTNEKEVEEIAKKIIHGMKQSFTVTENEIFSSPSLGISFFCEGDTAEALIDRANFALFLAKQRGRNNYQFYNDELNQKMKRKMMLEVRLHKAIEQEEFQVYFQPQVQLENGSISGAEALLRWECDLGKISPEEFIPITEETGLIIQIGEWVLRKTCHHIKWFTQNGLSPFPVSVNLSTKQLMHPHFIDLLKRIIDEEHVDPKLLTLEITERAFLDYEDAKDVIAELRKTGVGLSLDDFGVGYSSLSMIKNIEIDELKIDKLFLNDALESKRVRALLDTIIQIGKNLDAKIVVEGIETAEQHEILAKQGVQGQGYFYSPPLPAAEFEIWCHSFTKNNGYQVL